MFKIPILKIIHHWQNNTQLRFLTEIILILNYAPINVLYRIYYIILFKRHIKIKLRKVELRKYLHNLNAIKWMLLKTLKGMQI